MDRDVSVLDTSALAFPVALWHPECMHICSSEDTLTQATQLTIKHRWHEKAKVIDSTGKCYTLCGARILHGIGRFGGWDIFLTRTVRVALLTREEPRKMTLREFKGLAYRDMRGDPGWGGLAEYWEIFHGIKSATTVCEALAAMRLPGGE